MHESSYHEMQRFLNEYLSSDKPLKILDVGSYAVREESLTYKKLMSKNWDYAGLDMSEGRNVDYVIKDPHKWKEIKTKSFDVVISGQALEHSKYPWLVMKEIRRVLKYNGLTCIIAPASGDEHRFPIDCFRFYPDGMRSLAEDAKLKVLQCYCNNVLPWKDTVLIGRKE